MSEPPRPYVVRARMIIGAWFVVALVSLVAWARWELTHEPLPPRGCVDTCFGNVPLVLSSVMAGLIAWGVGVGFSPGTLRRHLNAGAHERHGAVRLGLVVAATCTGLGLVVTLFACGIPVMASLLS